MQTNRDRLPEIVRRSSETQNAAKLLRRHSRIFRAKATTLKTMMDTLSNFPETICSRSDQINEAMNAVEDHHGALREGAEIFEMTADLLLNGIDQGKIPKADLAPATAVLDAMQETVVAYRENTEIITEVFDVLRQRIVESRRKVELKIEEMRAERDLEESFLGLWYRFLFCELWSWSQPFL